jgi:hypothetical protein
MDFKKINIGDVLYRKTLHGFDIFIITNKTDKVITYNLYNILENLIMYCLGEKENKYSNNKQQCWTFEEIYFNKRSMHKYIRRTFKLKFENYDD